MSVFLTIITIISTVGRLLPGIRMVFTSLAELFDRVFDGDQNKAEAVMQQAAALVGHAEETMPVVDKWFRDSYPTIEALLTEWPKVAALMYASHGVAADNGIDRHTSVMAVVSAVNVAKLAAGTVATQEEMEALLQDPNFIKGQVPT